jgi:D-alanyl-D-alanine carboxypeptidase
MPQNHRKTIGLAIIFSICTVICANADAPVTRTHSLQYSAGSFIDSLMQKYSIPGAIIGIWINDTEKVLLCKGLSDIERKSPIGRSDQVRVGSITKTFVASVLLQLVDEGKLTLDDTLKKFLPEIPGSDRIIIRELCNHTSGIHDIVEDTGCSCGFLNHPFLPVAKLKLLDCLRETKCDFTPGENFSYSNTGYILLGMVVEKVTGHSLENEIQRRLLNRFGLRHTAFPHDSAFPAKFCHGYMLDTISHQLIDISRINPSGVWAAGAMVSTLDDMKRWAVLLANGAFLHPDTHRERLTFSQGWNDTSRYGLGVMKVNSFIGHSGGILGYNTGMFYDPDSQIIVIIIFNNCNYVDGHITETLLGISRIINGWK